MKEIINYIEKNLNQENVIKIEIKNSSIKKIIQENWLKIKKCFEINGKYLTENNI